MSEFNPNDLKKIYISPPNSHKGQNGKVLIIGGSHLFHSSAFWALEIASKIVDMVYFSSTPMNNEIVKKLKTLFRNGIIIPRNKLEEYIEEVDCILIGPGLPRLDGQEIGDDDTKILTEKWLSKFPNKRWVIDGGSLQVIEPEIIPKTAIVTPNGKEFSKLFNFQFSISNFQSNPNDQIIKIQNKVSEMARKYGITILLKGPVDIVCGPFDFAQGEIRCVRISGGNAGMTKGGTGDVLAGLVTAFYAKNDAFLSACSASFINKKAGESLSERVGLYFNASDLVNEIPKVMKELL